jgi:hypothetical protein
VSLSAASALTELAVWSLQRDAVDRFDGDVVIA